MKKLLVVLLALVLCLGIFVACGNKDKDETPDAVVCDVNAAATYVHGLYKDKGPTLTADFEVTSKVMVSDVLYTVEWTATEGATITKKNDNTYIVDINETTNTEYTFTLTATVKAPDGTSATKAFEFTVPKYVLNTFEEYMAMVEGDKATIRGIVVAINSKSLNNKYNHLFLADEAGKGGYYCYSLAKDPIADWGIEVGMTVEVTGDVAPYSGMQEIKNGTAKIVDATKKTVEVKDVTEAFAAGESFKNYVGMVVTIKGVEIGTQELATETSQYLYFKLNEKSGYVRTYVTDFPTTLPLTKDGDKTVSADKATIDAAHAEKFGWSANVTGIVVLYNSAPYLIPMGTDCFEYLAKIEKTPAQKVEEALEAVEVVDTITKATVVTLPTAVENFADVTLAWTIEGTDFAIVDNAVNVQIGAVATSFKLTVTATCGEASATKEFTVNVAANVTMSTTKPYIPTIYQAKLNGGTTLYLDGTFGERYLNTTTNPAEAVAIYAEAAEGGYKFYMLGENNAKCYIYIYKNSANKDAVKFDAENANVFTYNPTVNAWVTTYNNNEVYLGTYNTFNTISVSKTSYINAENTGVDQFPLEYKMVYEGVAMNATLYQAKIGEGTTLYLDGTFGERYLNTTTDVAAAVAIYAEKAEGGYKFYIIGEGDAKSYLYIYKNSANKDAVKFDAENANVFKYDGAVNAWVTTYNNNEVYLGTYNTFNTVSVSKTSYINATNTGVDQFPLNYVLAPQAAE